MSLRPVLRILGSVQSLFVKQFFFKSTNVIRLRMYGRDYCIDLIITVNPFLRQNSNGIVYSSRNCFLVEGMESPPYLSS